MRILVHGLCALLLATLMHGATLAAAASCDSLSSLKLPNATITVAQAVPAGGFTTPNLPGFCRVAATLTPSPDSDIKIEVWLPSSGWNGKFEAVGNGGWSGAIGYPAMGEALRRGYATASTDTGHTGGSASFALGHPEKLIDFAYRSEHEMTVKAKAIIAAYYGEAPRLSYWTGCSAGGRQGLKEAQRFPEDFNAIVAGAPASNWTGRAAQSLWITQAVHKDDASYIPPDKFAVIHNAVLAACDAADGVKDGVLEDPTRCAFDPKALECKANDGPSCLTAPQVEAVRRIYAGATNPRTKQIIFPGHERGSELGWNTMAGPRPFAIGLDHFRYVVFQDASWNASAFDFDGDYARTLKADNGAVNALDPDLTAFFSRGGKLLQYHGWSDPQISPASSVLYHESVLQAMGGANKVDSSYRLFMVPGMAHCGGGEGTSTFDMLSALEQWVEKGKTPDSIPAARVRDGKTDRTRPLCPYPQVARYKGTESTDEAANFACR